MKFFVKLLLIILFIPVAIVFIFSLTTKFQLLNSSFWKNNFKNNNVYANLSTDLKTYANNQVVKGGGKTSDLRIITDVITPTIIEDFIGRNLDNFLSFANGKRKDLIVYIPIN